MVAHNPLNRSGRAVLPHPALTSGDEAEAAQGIGMMKARSGQPAVSKPHHPVPAQPAVLAASRQGALPEPDRLEPKPVERGLVHGDPVVAFSLLLCAGINRRSVVNEKRHQGPLKPACCFTRS